MQTLAFTGFGDSTTLGPFMLHTFVGAQPMLGSHAASDGSWNNSLAWNSPAWGGFSTMVQVAAGENGPEGRRLDATLNWRQGRWSAALGHGRIRGASYALPRTRTDPAGAPYVIGQESSTLASLGHDFGAAQLSVQLADAQLQPRGLPAISLDTVGVNLTVPVGAGRLLASWARTQRSQAGVADADRSTLAAGYAYNLSKRTDVYAIVLHDRASRLASGTGYAAGLRHHF